MSSNIIDFESQIHTCKSTPHRNSVMRKFVKDRRKVTAFASLASVLVLVTFANLSLLSQKQVETVRGARGIASLEVENSRVSTIEDARNLLRKIESQSDRTPASLGQAPSLVDQLRFGVLEGKYALRMTDGKLRELEFVDTAQNEDRPKYVADGAAFLKDYKSLMPVSYDSVAKVSENLEGQRLKQVYSLMDKDGGVRGQAKFERDSYGRLLNFQISSEDKTKQ